VAQQTLRLRRGGTSDSRPEPEKREQAAWRTGPHPEVDHDEVQMSGSGRTQPHQHGGMTWSDVGGMA